MGRIVWFGTGLAVAGGPAVIGAVAILALVGGVSYWFGRRQTGGPPPALLALPT